MKPSPAVKETQGYFYLIGAIMLDGGLLYLAIHLWREQSKKWVRTLFWYSNIYLAAIFAIMVLDRVIHWHYSRSGDKQRAKASLAGTLASTAIIRKPCISRYY